MRYAIGLVASAIFWLLAWYWSTAQDIVTIWERSETHAHGFIIVPISAWLIWRRRLDLATLELRPEFLVLTLLGLTGFGWLLGQLAGAGVVQQYALVLMIPLTVWVILGSRIIETLAFPLFFLLLAVPFGEFLQPLLMEYTADFTVSALRLTGIPVYREGQFFTIPSGSWSVIEACSGLRYLIASLTLGLLYAYLTYRSMKRRVIFVALSIVVPILANWLRAYLIVMLGHLSNMTLAVGVDHLIYGWVFFGVVMLALFWLGSIWREDLEPPHGAVPESMRTARRNDPPLGRVATATVAAAVVVAVWPVLAAHLADAVAGRSPVLKAPALAGGWQPATAKIANWTPRFQTPRAQFDQTYARDGGLVGVHIGYYRNQGDGAKLITSENELVATNNREWGNVGEVRLTRAFNGEVIPLIEARLRSQSGRLLVWRWYRVDGVTTVNPYLAKLLQAKSMLLGRGDDGAVVMVYAPYESQPQAAEQAMQGFVDAMLPAITRSLDDARHAGK